MSQLVTLILVLCCVSTLLLSNHVGKVHCQFNSIGVWFGRTSSNRPDYEALFDTVYASRTSDLQLFWKLNTTIIEKTPYFSYKMSHVGACNGSECVQSPYLIDTFSLQILSVNETLVNGLNGEVDVRLAYSELYNVDPSKLQWSVTDQNNKNIDFNVKLSVIEMVLSISVSQIQIGQLTVKLSIQQNPNVALHPPFGEQVYVKYPQQNVYLGEAETTVTSTISSMNYDYQYSLSRMVTDPIKYYETVCSDGNIHALLRAYNFNTSSIIGEQSLLVDLKVSDSKVLDHFGNHVDVSVSNLNINTNMLPLDSSNFIAPSSVLLRLFGTNTYYVTAPLKIVQQEYPRSQSPIVGKVKKGELTSFSVNLGLYGVSSTGFVSVKVSSPAVVMISPTVSKAETCGDWYYGKMKKFRLSTFDTFLNVYNTNIFSTMYFKVFVGCLTDEDCEFEVKVYDNAQPIPQPSPTNPQNNNQLIAISIGSVLGIVVLSIVVGSILGFILKRHLERKGEMQTLL